MSGRTLSVPAASGTSLSPSLAKGASTRTNGNSLPPPLSTSFYPGVPSNWTTPDGVRWAWDPKQLPQTESLSVGAAGPSPKKENNPWTPQKPLVETPPPKPLEAPKGVDTDDTTPPKDLNTNGPPRRSHHRLVPTPQNAHIQGPLRSKLPSRKDTLADSKPSPATCDADTPSQQARRSHRRAEYPADAEEAPFAASAGTPLSGQPAVASQSAVTPKPAENAGTPVKEFLPEFSVTSSRLSRESALCSLEELPNSVRHALMFCRNVPALPCTPPGSRPAMLPPARFRSRPTLVLDLDETLVHCSRSSSSRSGPPPANPDLIVQFDDGQPSTGAVAFRPYVHHFLKAASKVFEMVVFTASQQSYADKVIDALDPDGTLIQHRLYRQHCTEHRGAFFKELSLLGRPLHQCILVDNSPISCACNADNSILCRSWYSDPNDQELYDLLSVFKGMQLNSGGDCSWYLAVRYGLREFFQGLRDSVGRQ